MLRRWRKGQEPWNISEKLKSLETEFPQSLQKEPVLPTTPDVRASASRPLHESVTF